LKQSKHNYIALTFDPNNGDVLQTVHAKSSFRKNPYKLRCKTHKFP